MPRSLPACAFQCGVSSPPPQAGGGGQRMLELQQRMLELQVLCTDKSEPEVEWRLHISPRCVNY